MTGRKPNHGVVMYLPAQRTRNLLVVALILFFGSLAVRGKDGAHPKRTKMTNLLTIVNPGQVEVPGDRAKVLLVTTCRVVADELHRKPNDVELKMTLVLGEGAEYYSIDKEGRMTLYLEHWDEVKFVNGVITSVVQRLAPLHLRNQMFTEILRRTDRIEPVSAQQLQRHGNSPLPTTESYPTCSSEVAATPCSALTRPRRP